MKNIIHAQGSRKQAVARAVLYQDGKGNVIINNQKLEQYGNDVSRLRISEPLVLMGAKAKSVNINVTVNGGGMNGQADAIRLAIARALVQHDPKLKKEFTEYDRLLLVADVRRKEVCKPNDSKARAKRQKSYR
ncbi:30S ribosomal protein S9 [Candidatus Woesearchaeota archaeon]|jgi:small subunit ribosomal protein S9|nr:30S ribosomal protein S9 [Candidatus Woesearchaeota archaeon]MBT5397001.1 30S ribosomal protein S9 [Candidatus Woesearchaeota archaeon]MBT5924092.1 30S ribosomal protein S9 [Candidatus Woesearchaeota archaeon]MBT6367453.1 30S ribosomal protein S9 [Candidatus Woesearchaeota archaeon]MBT7762401.1 30S ribosomal protein S9 [Candidatus Woesearchaeota archaeon]